MATLAEIFASFKLINFGALFQSGAGNSGGNTPASITLQPNPFSMVVGSSDVTISPIVKNASGHVITNAVTYTSDNTSVATVNSTTGVVHAVSAPATTIGSDAVTRADSTTTLGTADVGGAYTAVVGTWGVSGNAGYSVTGANSDVATLTLASPAAEYGADLSTNNIQNHCLGLYVRYQDSSNTLRIGYNAANDLILVSRVAGVSTTRMSAPSGLVSTGAAAFTASATISVSNVVTCFINGVQIGTPYTLTATEIAAYGAATKVGFLLTVFGTDTKTLCTFKNLYAKGRTTATITGTTTNGKTGTAIAIVSVDTAPASCVMTPNTVTITVGGADVNMTTTVTNAAGTVLTTAQAPVSYTSDNTAIATITSPGGVVHAVAAGTCTVRAQTSVTGVFDTSAVTIQPAAVSGQRTLKFPFGARVRLIARSPSRDNATDRAFINSHYDDVEDTSANGTLAGHPNAISVQHYGLLAKLEVDSGSIFTPDGSGGGSWNYRANGTMADGSIPGTTGVDISAAYATANGIDDETMWLHVPTGGQNKICGITSISSAGAVVFNNPLAAGQTSSFPFAVGNSVTLTGLSVGNGVYTIASLQRFGVTLTGWTGGDLNVGGAVNTSKIGTLYVPGTGAATFANRKWWMTFNEWRMIPYYGSADACQVAANRFKLQLQNAGNPINAVLIDEMDGSIYQQAHVISMEYPTSGWASSTSDPVVCQYTLDINKALTKIRADNPGILLRINTASYDFANNKSMLLAAGGAHQEQLLSIFSGDTSGLDFFIACVNAGADCEFVDGGTWLTAANNGGVTPVPGVMQASASYVAGNYPTSSARRQMSAYVFYLMGMDAVQTNADGTQFKHAIIDLSNSNSSDIPISAHWTPAFETPLGNPTAAYVKGAAVTPPTGQAVRPLSRSFSLDGGTTVAAHAVIMVTSGTPPAGVTATNYDDTSLVTYTLPAAPSGKVWFQLGQDGSVGTTPLTTLSIRRAEGIVVLAKDAGVLAQRADTFVDSIGTNIHMDAAPYNAHFSDWVIPAMLNLGIRKVRSGAFGSGADTPINLTSLLASEAGTKFTLVTNPGSTYTDMSIQDYMLAHIGDVSTIDCMEGPNEVDNNNTLWGGDPAYLTNVKTFMSALKTDITGNSNATVRAIPISTPSVTSAYGAGHGGTTLDCSSFATFGTVHPYPLNGQEPGSQLAGSVANVKPVFAELTPYIVTETGYQTAPNATSPSYEIGQGVSEAVHAKYLPRLWAEYFKQGVTRTFNYELFDDGIDSTNGESNFGLYRADNTQKPVVASIKNLIAILGERTWTGPSASLGTAYVDDTFTRANASGWGTATSGADTNKTWVDGDSAESSHWSITSNAGVAVSTSQIRNIIGDSHSGDVEYFVQLRNVRASYSNLFRIYGRWVDLTHNYSFDFNPGVTDQVSINKNNASTLASAAASGYALLTSPNLRFRIRTIGSDVYLYAKIWDSALTEPTTWDLTAIDKAPASGYLAGATAVWCDNNASGQSMKLTRFTASPVTVTAGSYSALTALTPGRLAYTLTGTTANLQDLLLQKADGSYWLVLWNRVQCWDQSTKQDITNAPVSVTVATTATHNWTTYQPSAGTSGTVVGTGVTSVTLSVPDELLIVKIV